VVAQSRRAGSPTRPKLNLGLVYTSGEKCGRIIFLAYMWLNLAASRSVHRKKELRDRGWITRDSIATRMTLLR